VAIKLINPQRSEPDLVAHFERERDILASLKHPHIATLFDAGRSDDGRLFLVMEYVDGIPITAFCAQRRLRIRDRVLLFLSVCDAVAYAHRGLVVHRDLKPTNILVEASGTPKLLDFGIAKLLTPSGLEATDLTDPLLRRATPAYASPEQLSGERAHTGMDVFALGVILHELLTGAADLRQQ
jgi:serine/threonine protein kinase